MCRDIGVGRKSHVMMKVWENNIIESRLNIARHLCAYTHVYATTLLDNLFDV